MVETYTRDGEVTVIQAQLIKVRLEVRELRKLLPAQPIKIMPQGKD